MGRAGLEERLRTDFNLNLPIAEWLDKEPDLHEEVLRERIMTHAMESYAEKKRSSAQR